jgi:aconitate hydratase
MAPLDSFGTRRHLTVGSSSYGYHSLRAFALAVGLSLDRLPFSLRVLLENLLRNEDGEAVTEADLAAFARRADGRADDPTTEQEVAFHPARVLMPDSSGIPLLVDLAAMRDAVADGGSTRAGSSRSSPPTSASTTRWR